MASFERSSGPGRGSGRRVRSPAVARPSTPVPTRPKRLGPTWTADDWNALWVWKAQVGPESQLVLPAALLEELQAQPEPTTLAAAVERMESALGILSVCRGQLPEGLRTEGKQLDAAALGVVGATAQAVWKLDSDGFEPRVGVRAAWLESLRLPSASLTPPEWFHQSELSRGRQEAALLGNDFVTGESYHVDGDAEHGFTESWVLSGMNLQEPCREAALRNARRAGSPLAPEQLPDPSVLASLLGHENIASHLRKLGYKVETEGSRHVARLHVGEHKARPLVWATLRFDDQRVTTIGLRLFDPVLRTVDETVRLRDGALTEHTLSRNTGF